MSDPNTYVARVDAPGNSTGKLGPSAGSGTFLDRLIVGKERSCPLDDGEVHHGSVYLDGSVAIC